MKIKLTDIVKNERFYLFLIVILGASLWSYRLGAVDLQHLSAAEALFAKESIFTIFFKMKWRNQSPLYFAIQHFWMFFGDSAFNLRLLNVFFQTLTVIFTYRLAEAFYRSAKVSLAAALFMAVSPYSIMLCQEGRFYPLFSFLSTASVYYLYRFSTTGQRRPLVGFAIVTILNIYTHFLAFLVLGIQFLYAMLLIWKDEQFRKFTKDFFISIGAIAVAILPQLIRAYFVYNKLNTSASARTKWALSRNFIEYVHSIIYYHFIHANTFLPKWVHARLAEAFIISLLGLFIVGWACSPRRIKWFTGLWVFIAIVMTCLWGAVSNTADIRARYFVFIPPLIASTATFAVFCPLHRLKNKKALLAGVNILRGMMLVMILALSTWFLCNKWFRDPTGWSSIMLQIDREDHQNASLYIVPHWAQGGAKYAAITNKLDPILEDITAISKESGEKFAEDIATGRDIFVLTAWNTRSKEYNRMAATLSAKNYTKEKRLKSKGVVVDIYRAGNSEEAFFVDYIASPLTAEKAVKWAMRQLAKMAAVDPERKNPLQGGLFARLDDKGSVIKSTEPLTKEGSPDRWAFGGKKREEMFYSFFSSSGVTRRMIWAHPKSHSALLLAFPGVTMQRSVKIIYGVADSGFRQTGDADVKGDVYIDGEAVKSFTCQNTFGWKEVIIDTERYSGSKKDLIVFLRTPDNILRNFCLNYQIEGDQRAEDNMPSHESFDGRLTSENTLCRHMKSLTAYRLIDDGSRKNAVVFNQETASSRQMHESTKFADEGWVSQRWVIGNKDWDCVGYTKQRSAGVTKEGIWAHPKSKTVLCIESKQFKFKGNLSGFAGFTDFSIGQAREKNVSAPVHFTIRLNGALIYETSYPREKGWKDFTVPLELPSPSERDELAVEIRTEQDNWAHFIFDLWSE